MPEIRPTSSRGNVSSSRIRSEASSKTDASRGFACPRGDEPPRPAHALKARVHVVDASSDARLMSIQSRRSNSEVRRRLDRSITMELLPSRYLSL
jgi:hypothetical protein